VECLWGESLPKLEGALESLVEGVERGEEGDEEEEGG
jgi:hypothetical protein